MKKICGFVKNNLNTRVRRHFYTAHAHSKFEQRVTPQKPYAKWTNIFMKLKRSKQRVRLKYASKYIRQILFIRFVSFVCMPYCFSGVEINHLSLCIFFCPLSLSHWFFFSFYSKVGVISIIQVPHFQGYELNDMLIPLLYFRICGKNLNEIFPYTPITGNFLMFVNVMVRIKSQNPFLMFCNFRHHFMPLYVACFPVHALWTAFFAQPCSHHCCRVIFFRLLLLCYSWNSLTHNHIFLNLLLPMLYLSEKNPCFILAILLLFLF